VPTNNFSLLCAVLGEHFGASQAPKLMTIDESAAVRFLFYYWKRKANLMARAHICIFSTMRAHNSTCMLPFCPTLIEKTTPDAVINRAPEHIPHV
jgi:hypothetical protein